MSILSSEYTSMLHLGHGWVLYNTPEYATFQEALTFISVIMNSTDEGSVQKQFPEDPEYSLEKCKQPPCVL